MDAPVLLTGATGYIGGRLLRHLEGAGRPVRCLARNPERVRATRSTTEVVQGDCLADQAGSLSSHLQLVERLPVMVCPRWVTTLTQPMAVDDVVAYLTAALELSDTGNEMFAIGGPGRVPLVVPVTLFGHHIRRCGAPYLGDQVY